MTDRRLRMIKTLPGDRLWFFSIYIESAGLAGDIAEHVNKVFLAVDDNV